MYNIIINKYGNFCNLRIMSIILLKNMKTPYFFSQNPYFRGNLYVNLYILGKSGRLATLLANCRLATALNCTLKNSLLVRGNRDRTFTTFLSFNAHASILRFSLFLYPPRRCCYCCSYSKIIIM